MTTIERRKRLDLDTQETALRIIAEWLGHYMKRPGRKPAPTGQKAYEEGRGPVLVSEFGPGGSRPAIVMENEYGDWAYDLPHEVIDRLKGIGVRVESYYGGWDLCLYSTEYEEVEVEA